MKTEGFTWKKFSVLAGKLGILVEYKNNKTFRLRQNDYRLPAVSIEYCQPSSKTQTTLWLPFSRGNCVRDDIRKSQLRNQKTIANFFLFPGLAKPLSMGTHEETAKSLACQWWRKIAWSWMMTQGLGASNWITFIFSYLWSSKEMHTEIENFVRSFPIAIENFKSTRTLKETLNSLENWSFPLKSQTLKYEACLEQAFGSPQQNMILGPLKIETAFGLFHCRKWPPIDAEISTRNPEQCRHTIAFESFFKFNYSAKSIFLWN